MKLALSDVDRIARDAATALAGPDVFTDLKVTVEDDWMGDPIYNILLRTDADAAYQPAFQINLILSIIDKLAEHDDMRYPILQMVGADDWVQK